MADLRTNRGMLSLDKQLSNAAALFRSVLFGNWDKWAGYLLANRQLWSWWKGLSHSWYSQGNSAKYMQYHWSSNASKGKKTSVSHPDQKYESQAKTGEKISVFKYGGLQERYIQQRS